MGAVALVGAARQVTLRAGVGGGYAGGYAGDMAIRERRPSIDDRSIPGRGDG